MTDASGQVPTIHHTIRPGQISANPTPVRFEAAADEREVLARMLDVEEVLSFSADLTARSDRSRAVRVKGRVRALLVQESVVTLEPLRRQVEETLDLTFAEERSRAAAPEDLHPAEIDIDPQADDPPETYSGGAIDIGPYLAEAIALGIDPYPREADEDYVAVDTDPDPGAGRRSPFAVLKDMPATKDGRKP